MLSIWSSGFVTPHIQFVDKERFPEYLIKKLLQSTTDMILFAAQVIAV